MNYPDISTPCKIPQFLKMHHFEAPVIGLGHFEGQWEILVFPMGFSSAKCRGFLQILPSVACCRQAQLIKRKTWHPCWVKSKAEAPVPQSRRFLKRFWILICLKHRAKHLEADRQVDPSGLQNYAQTAWCLHRTCTELAQNYNCSLDLDT